MNDLKEIEAAAARPGVFDCHAHLGPSPLRDDGLGLGQLLERCSQQGIVGVIDCLMFREQPLAQEIAARRSLGQGRSVQLRCALGFPPPCRVATLERWEAERAEAERQFRLLVREPGVVALGEVGLDDYWLLVDWLVQVRGLDFERAREEVSRGRVRVGDEPGLAGHRAAQQEGFRRWIALAGELALPLVVHIRDATEEALELLQEARDPARVMIHCFAGTPAQAERALRQGHVISVPSSVGRRPVFQAVARVVPLERMVLETDAPYHSPISNLWTQARQMAEAAVRQLKGRAREEWIADQTRLRFGELLAEELPGLQFPVRSKPGETAGPQWQPAREYFLSSGHRAQNEPAFVRCGATAVARLRGRTMEEVCAVTTDNARRLFGLTVE